MASRLCLVERERDGVVGVCKRLAPRAAEDEGMRQLLVAEGRVLERLAGRGAPRLLASGEDGLGPWIVMTRIEAPPLAARAGSLGARGAVVAAASLFRALAAVHACEVVHSDVSPSNVLLSDRALAGDRLSSGLAGPLPRHEASATLVDFGLCRWDGAPAPPPGPFRGTLLYAAPELARGEPFDRRADLFSAAAALLHIHSGQPPRSQRSDAAMLLAAGDEPIDPWSVGASADLPAPARDALVACCAFDAANRPLSADEALDRFARKGREL